MSEEDVKNDTVEPTASETKEAETEAPQTEPTPIEGGVEDKVVSNTAAEVTPEDQPDLPDANQNENELIRQSVQALTDFSNFRQ